MSYKKLIPWWQEGLHSVIVRVVVKVVVTICLTASVLGILGSNAPIGHAQTAITPNATVYRSPDCSCCHGWIDHLNSQGFHIEDVPTNDIETIKQKHNVPDNLASCHTAIVNGYVVEGHVPAQDIKRLLQEKPNVTGLSVPQMPIGTPGMEMGNQKDPFSVISFDPKGRDGIFNQYPGS